MKQISEYTEEELQSIISENNAHRAAKEQADVRPIRLPSDLTVGEYNFLVEYLIDQRRRILNSNPKIPKKIETKEGIEFAVPKKPKKKELLN